MVTKIKNSKGYLWEKLVNSSDGICPLCKKHLDLKMYKLYIRLKKLERNNKKKSYRGMRKKIDLSIDHIIPKSKGGTWDYKNLQLTHKRCNSLKGNKLDYGTTIQKEN